MTPEVCVAHGGHCWVRRDEWAMTEPSTCTEDCKHCPVYRTGQPQPQIAWGEPQVPS